MFNIEFVTTKDFPTFIKIRNKQDPIIFRDTKLTRIDILTDAPANTIFNLDLELDATSKSEKVDILKDNRRALVKADKLGQELSMCRIPYEVNNEITGLKDRVLKSFELDYIGKYGLRKIFDEKIPIIFLHGKVTEFLIQTIKKELKLIDPPSRPWLLT